MFDEGGGPPVIVIPGVQGRWEWMRPGLAALAKRCRTVSYTLCGDFGSDMKFDCALGFDNFLRQIDDLFERTGFQQAAICGVSYGGFIALRYAAARPERVTSLIFVSAPAPGWTPSNRQTRHIARPWLSTPAFVLAAPRRVWPEIRMAFDTAGAALWFMARHAVRVLSAPVIPASMAARVRLQQAIDFEPECARITAPTLVVTGEDGMDTVVPTESTLRYLELIPGARFERLERSGHIGLITRPERFAEIVAGFVQHGNRH
jgi:pimeloyl-ACP methyl ester carboxylesterase